MKKLVLGGVVIAASVIFAAILWQGDNEARYAGRPVSEWFEQFAMSGFVKAADREEALYALRKLGTNAVPHLLAKAFTFREDTKFAKVMQELRIAVTQAVTQKPRRYVDPRSLTVEAGFALKAMQLPADILVPPLTNALHSTDPKKQRQALQLFGQLQLEEGVPYLAKALNDPEFKTRVIASQALTDMGAKSAAALPEMIQAMEGKLQYDGYAVMTALANVGPAAKAAVPAMEQFLNATNRQSHVRAAVAILQIDPDHEKARTIVEQAEAEEVVRCLNRISNQTDLLPIIQAALEQEARNPDQRRHTRALHVLQTVAPELTQSILEEHMHSDSNPINVQLWAAGWILRLNRNHEEALAAIIKFLANPKHDPTWTTYAISQLGEAPAKSESAQSMLKTLSEPTTAQDLRDWAEQSLKRLKIRELNEQEGRAEKF